MAGFSAGLKLTGVDDFITPSQACVLPLMGENEGANEVMRHKKEAKGKDEKVKLDLADCLACSGCVTTAETILMEEQSLGKILEEVGKKGDRKFVVTLSPQAIASVGAHFGSNAVEAYSRLVTFFKKHLNFDIVMDLIWAQAVSVTETTTEALARLGSRTELPLITSACPGLVCYAEKKERKLLQHLSSSQSAQAIAGKVLKTYFAKQWALTPGEIYHISVQPCYDKKLEATRKELREQSEDGARYTDMVIASHEVIDLMKEVKVAWEDLAPSNPTWSSLVGGEIMKLVPSGGKDPFLEGSGGYAAIAMMEVAKVHGVELCVDDVHSGGKGENWEVVHNKKRPNFTEMTLKVKGAPVFKAALAYGFKHISNLVRVTRLKPANFTNYDYIELMACPEGCVNGGGQIKPAGDEKNADLVQRVRHLCHSLLHSHPSDISEVLTINSLYDYVGSSPGSQPAKEYLHTTYNDLNPKEGAQPSLTTMSW